MYVYILSNRVRTLYIGVTRDLERRLYEHKCKLVDGFTKRYNVTWLVYYESTDNPEAAIAREKELKGWRGAKKIRLIESVNPRWRDLSLEWSRHDIDALDPSAAPSG